jgi:hypothetical protein
MKTLHQITNRLRKSSTPTGVNNAQWANAVNWTIEAWKCYLAGQKWMHALTICAPEQYYALLNKTGELIVGNKSLLRFENNGAISNWTAQLKEQIADMRSKGEFNESLRWGRILAELEQFMLPTPNENSIKTMKPRVKGHRLIRIKAA